MGRPLSAVKRMTQTSRGSRRVGNVPPEAEIARSASTAQNFLGGGPR